MLRKFGFAFLFLLGAMPMARADDKLTVLLDWFVNPDHAPLFVAQYMGAYEKEGLEVKFIAPADPSTPPREVAAGQGDLALSYQPQLYMLVDAGLPVVRVGTRSGSIVLRRATIFPSYAEIKGHSVAQDASLHARSPVRDSIDLSSERVIRECSRVGVRLA